jgi:hypothetical protein
MVQSFVSTQKQSVQRSMTRKFAQFVSTRGDNFELVLTVLRGMLRDQERLVQAGMMPDGADPGHVTSRCFVMAAADPAARCAPVHQLCRRIGMCAVTVCADASQLLRSLEERLRQYGVVDLSGFYDSAAFGSSGFKMEPADNPAERKLMYA